MWVVVVWLIPKFHWPQLSFILFLVKPYLTKEQGVALFEGGSVQFPGVLLFQLYSSYHVPLSCFTYP